VPRHNFGKFVDAAMHFVPASERIVHYGDLFYQKQQLVRAFINRTNPISSEEGLRKKKKKREK